MLPAVDKAAVGRAAMVGWAGHMFPEYSKAALVYDIFDSIITFWLDVTSWVCEGRSGRQLLTIVFASLLLFASLMSAAFYLMNR